MKKLIALVLVLMLMAAAACAEGLPYIRQLEQYQYINTALLTEESYPEACLYTWYAGYYFGTSDHEALCLVFPGPAGANPVSFDSESVHYLDVENLIQYDYNLEQSDSFEEFLNKAEDDQYILLEGDGGVAAYIDPSDYGGNAYGLIATKDFGKSSKLWIRISLDKLDRKMPIEDRISALSDAILAEVQRVKDSMHTEVRAPFWSAGKFGGIKLLDNDFTKLVKLDFPALQASFKDTAALQADNLIVTSLRYGKMEGIYDFGDGHTIEIEFGMDSYSYPVYQLENDNNPDVKKLKLDNGSEWYFFASNTNDDGSIFAWYGSKAVEGMTDHYDKQIYLNFRFSGSYGIVWPDEEACRQILALYDPLITISNPKDDPYVAPEKPAAPEPTSVDVPDAAEGWTCVNGHEGNTGNFCAVCGAAKPEPEPDVAPADGSWVCPECSTENTGNFCANCGTPKPEASAEWTCPGCGQVNEGKFCSNCGTPKP